MATMKVSADFKDFLKLLNEKKVEYLLIGGYAVGYHGYPRSTGDMDIWVRFSPENAVLTAEALQEFGYAKKDQSLPVLLHLGKILRMGFPPFRLEVSTDIDGVKFDECYANHVVVKVDDISITLIGYEDLLTNKRAAGRLKDMLDVEELENRNK